jgi:hypothetical protein
MFEHIVLGGLSRYFQRLMSRAERDPRARCLANLAPDHAAALRPPAQLTMRDALGLRTLDHRPSRASCTVAPPEAEVLPVHTRAAARDMQAQQPAQSVTGICMTRVSRPLT